MRLWLAVLFWREKGEGLMNVGETFQLLGWMRLHKIWIVAAGVLLMSVYVHAQDQQTSDKSFNVLAPGFNIYLLQDETLTWDDCNSTPLKELELRSEPWIRASDILRYDISTHCMTLKQTRPLPIERVSLRGNPFVVTAGDKRRYLGALWTPLSSYLPMGVTPMINIPKFSYPTNVVGLELLRCLREGQQAESLPDKRTDPDVLAALKDQDVLHAGLSITMGPVNVISDANQSSVTYTYTLTNQDIDPLYVFDPYTMGSPLFHSFSNPPFLMGPTKRFEGRNREALDQDVCNQYNKEWFTLVWPGESRTWFVTAKGYPSIPSGQYEYGFGFGSPRILEGQPWN